MRPPTLRCTAVLWLTCVGLAQEQKNEETVHELVYKLVDPRDRLAVQEKLLGAGKKALPLLMQAILERDFKHGNRSWSDLNRIPELAELTGDDIRNHAIVAALAVVQEMGASARPVLPDLLSIFRGGIAAKAGRHDACQQNICATITAIALASGERELLLETHFFANGSQLHFDSNETTKNLVESVSKPENQRGNYGHFRSACTLLGFRARDIVADPDTRKALIRVLESIVRDNPATPNVWPMFEDFKLTRRDDWAREQESYRKTQTHDFASLLLARIDPRRPTALRGNMILLADLRHRTRLRAAVDLGTLGATAGPAQFCLIERLRDPFPRVRQAAITSLGLIGSRAFAAIPHLRLLAHGEDKSLATLAKAALRHVDPKPSEMWTYYHFSGK